MGDIFLSASVPNPRSENFVRSADTVAITSAVTALAYVTLGRKIIVWGGHPAITPMVASIARSLSTDYSKWTKLYQSEFFSGRMPQDNITFPGIVQTAAGADEAESLRIMRCQMFEENDFDCAIFVGGMSGIFCEHELLSELHPLVPCFPIASTGGAAAKLLSLFPPSSISPQRLENDLDYISLFREITGIGFNEERHRFDK